VNIDKIVIFVLIGVLAAPSAFARKQTEPPEVWRAYADRLEAGAFIRVKLKDRTQVQGHFIMVDANALRLKPKTRIPVAIRDLSFADIESIDRQREGWSPGAKVLTGVAVGLGTLVILAFGVFLAYD
jgi:hypothetical protein